MVVGQVGLNLFGCADDGRCGVAVHLLQGVYEATYLVVEL